MRRKIFDGKSTQDRTDSDQISHITSGLWNDLCVAKPTHLNPKNAAHSRSL